jgi:hypothetical protein
MPFVPEEVYANIYDEWELSLEKQLAGKYHKV